jgi:hypothetical protein
LVTIVVILGEDFAPDVIYGIRGFRASGFRASVFLDIIRRLWDGSVLELEEPELTEDIVPARTSPTSRPRTDKRFIYIDGGWVAENIRVYNTDCFRRYGACVTLCLVLIHT